MKSGLNQFIRIRNWASISALGADQNQVWRNYLKGDPLFSKRSFEGREILLSSLPEDLDLKLIELRARHKSYRRLDRSVVMAMFCAQKLFEERGASSFNAQEIGINIGSSRGATGLWESYYSDFCKEGGRLSPYASPTTTAGNISSWVARDLGTTGLAFSHSVTCSTGLHALVNAASWLISGFAKRVIAGGTEAPLTDFTIAQMFALGLWSQRDAEKFPCLPLGEKNPGENTFILGEGCALFDLELFNPDSFVEGDLLIEGIGFANEISEGLTGISQEGAALKLSMQRALKGISGPVDVVIAHAPGTYLGDLAELNAICSVFSEHQECLPVLTSNKQLIGHSFAASGPLSVEMACLMLKNQALIVPGYSLLKGLKGASNPRTNPGEPLQRVMISSTGFGGNVVSIIISNATSLEH